MQEPTTPIEQETSLELNEETLQPKAEALVQPESEEPFRPRGSLVFFGLLIIIIGVIWFSVYLTMISRS